MRQPNNQVVAELEELLVEGGGALNPEAVVKRAKRVRSALHPYFEWDDGEAAHQFRLEQARKLLRVWVTILPQKPTTPVRVVVSLRDDRGTRGYRTLVDVMGDKALRAKLLVEAKGEMNRFRRKYCLLEELAGVFQAMDKVK